ncbi:MFS transporter [Desulfuromonas sp. KJ2020]|uniref:MFS transporter n=1 Tax=Desulfuromonas sp. KJ2020 TaxID=2919173 RepID=UPI0020A6F34C|nr:MFS transporter [Desulfuromonas sp. KJ2020]MCP3175958.1 MFS transporter [Desulfuromonas sp. KJ2020]
MIGDKQRPMLRFLIVQSTASVVGLQGWMILFNNFAVEEAGLNGQQIGMLGSIREVPGFLALLAVFVLLVLREHRLSALSVTLLGLGVGLTGFFPSYSGLILTTLIMSFGFHYYETTNQSLTLQYFSTAVSPLIFGRLRSLAAATSILVGLLIFLMGQSLSYRTMFLVIGALVTAAGIWGLWQDPTHRNLAPQRTEMVFRRQYALFYFLTFMSGARRQIFMAFAVFLMVKVFAFSVTEITLLFVVNNAVNFFLSPAIGRAIVRFGERAILSVEYAGLIVIFLLYATTESRWVVVALYILDHILFNFAIAIRTYFQKIAEPGDIAPSMAVSFTINHIAAVVIPAIGGALWMVDYSIPFVAGAVMSLISLVAVQRIPRLKRA